MTSPYGTVAATQVADGLRDRFGDEPLETVIVLGSGLGGLAEDIEDAVRVPYAAVPGFPTATVAGHAGALIAGRLAGQRVLAVAGRFHMYEGHDAALAAFPIRVAHALGARTLVVTNAAGGVRPTFRPGDLMLIDDHINLAFRNPLIGEVEPGDVRFPDMSAPYDAALQEVAREVAAAEGIPLERGTYMWLIGPTYETAAEVRMAGLLGADAVGMSTVPEVVVARARGMRVLGISCITNLACGLSGEEITHAEVLETTARVGTRLRRLITEVVRRSAGRDKARGG